MDQFSHDLTVALEETSLLNRARFGRRRTRSTGNLPSAPQPTEDSSSSPTDTIAVARPLLKDGLNTNITNVQLSDSDDKEQLTLRLPNKPFTKTAIQRLATLESDSLNENFSPARFFKPNTRRKRKLKRMSVEYDVTAAVANIVPSTTSNTSFCMDATPTTFFNTLRKRCLKTDVSAHRSGNTLFCGKRKRSNRDRYHEHGENSINIGRSVLHSCSMPRYNHWNEYRGMRPRSFSSTSKPHNERCLLPLNKGLISKIEKISQLQKTDDNIISICLEQHQQQQSSQGLLLVNNKSVTLENNEMSETEMIDQNEQKLTTKQQLPLIIPITIITTTTTTTTTTATNPIITTTKISPIKINSKLLTTTATPIITTVTTITTTTPPLKTIITTPAQLESLEFQGRRSGNKQIKSRHSTAHNNCNHSQLQQQLQFAVDQYSMDCSELNDFSNSSSLSSSDSDDGRTANGTDREGDDELTDWPGNNEFGGMGFDFKRKLTKKSQLPQIRSDDMDGESSEILDADAQQDTQLEMRYQPSEPITITQTQRPGFGFTGNNTSFGSGSGSRAGLSETGLSGGACHSTELSSHEHDISIPIVKQIESEMSGETSTHFLSSPPCQVTEVREIRAGCRRIKGERPGFSIKTSVNERLARFLQDANQIQMRMPDIEIYEQESLISFATLYSLKMTQDNGCVVLTKTRLIFFFF